MCALRGGWRTSGRRPRRRRRRRPAPGPRGRAPRARPRRPCLGPSIATVDDGDRASAGPVRQRRAQRQAHHLLRRPLGVAAGLGAEGDAAARRTAARAWSPVVRCPSPSGGTAWRPPPRTSARVLVDWVPDRRRGQLGGHDLVQDGHVGLDPEDARLEVDRRRAPCRSTSRRSAVRTSGSGRPLLHRAAHVLVGAHLRSARDGLHDVAQHDHAAAGAGDGALHEHELALGVGPDDLEVEGRHPVAAHATGHPRPLEHPGRRGAGADRAGRPVVLVVAVGRRPGP